MAETHFQIQEKKCIQEFAESIKDNDIKIATVSGRYYAMDRDNRWERTIEAYEAIAFAKAPRYDDAVSLIDENYKNNITDEFIRPAVIGDYQGIEPEDGLLLANFRADRMIQLASILSGVIPARDTGIYTRTTEGRERKTIPFNSKYDAI